MELNGVELNDELEENVVEYVDGFPRLDRLKLDDEPKLDDELVLDDNALIVLPEEVLEEGCSVVTMTCVFEDVPPIVNSISDVVKGFNDFVGSII